MKAVYFGVYHDLSILNVNYTLHLDNINWIPPSQWHGNRALWDATSVIGPIKRAVMNTYYLPLKEDMDALRKRLLGE